VAITTKGGRSPYLTDELTIVMRRSRLGMAWRWRSELLLTLAVLIGYFRLAAATSLADAAVILAGTLIILATVPHTRRFLLARFWCLVTRHRLQRACWELRLHTRAGRLPLILWTRPTKVGERAYILARAGIRSADFTDAAPDFAAACGAREARVTISQRWAHLLTIDIMRRDLLEPRRTVPSVLVDVVGPIVVPLPREDPEPVTDTPGWPEIGPGDALS
jgi:hypothetical protein